MPSAANCELSECPHRAGNIGGFMGPTGRLATSMRMLPTAPRSPHVLAMTSATKRLGNRLPRRFPNGRLSCCGSTISQMEAVEYIALRSPCHQLASNCVPNPSKIGLLAVRLTDEHSLMYQRNSALGFFGTLILVVRTMGSLSRPRKSAKGGPSIEPKL